MSQDIENLVLDAITQVAPDVDRDSIAPDTDLQYELDLDSMDALNIVTILSEKLGIDIPERDYGRMTTVGSTVAYLAERTDVPAS